MLRKMARYKSAVKKGEVPGYAKIREFASNPKRLRLASNYAKIISDYINDGTINPEAIIVHGSFITDKASPNDIDIIIKQDGMGERVSRYSDKGIDMSVTSHPDKIFKASLRRLQIYPNKPWESPGLNFSTD